MRDYRSSFISNQKCPSPTPPEFSRVLPSNAKTVALGITYCFVSPPLALKFRPTVAGQAFSSFWPWMHLKKRTVHGKTRYVRSRTFAFFALGALKKNNARATRLSFVNPRWAALLASSATAVWLFSWNSRETYTSICCKRESVDTKSDGNDPISCLAHVCKRKWDHVLNFAKKKIIGIRKNQNHPESVY